MATKKKVAKKATGKSSRAKKVADLKSFQMYKETGPFMTFKFTEQTIYWAVLFIYVLALSLWVLNIQLDILRIIDSINYS